MDLKKKVKQSFSEQQIVDLEQQSIEDTHLEVIANINTKNIQSINLGWNNLTSQGMLIFSSKAWQKLTDIYVWNNRIQTKGVLYLSRCEFPQLKVINIGGNQIGDQGFMHLSKSNWKTLESINIWKNQGAIFDFAYFSKANWKKLSDLDLGSNKFHICSLLKILYFNKNDNKAFFTINVSANKLEYADQIFLEQVLTQKHCNSLIEF